MKKILVAVAMLTMAVGCGGNAGDEILGKAREFKNKTCACKDVACLDAVEKEADAWMESAMKKYKDFKPSKSQDEEFDKIGDEARACEDKIKSAAPPPP